ncbi:MAG TPA: UvrD-helicase domain-containing protein [Accumulibacter sp.]|nr:UvrD-helicase domain-containing protein [Accumulibacter sp.]HMW16330.1 UvrD-helicase domain-containing protein [Accumulibacter sp.]HMX21975.1 UvrD-helicase domain-containing protein [Accumulibacter sp.]HNC17095.1 UvrD-helicase domain-containing protein [Accumulibacter sp.]HND78922.1 UvrD-helicase domain-containing protein [Accumulibacter sp.]
MSDLLADLNPPQHAAVTLSARHALILAGAGSGKTRVLTTRIAWLLSNARISPQAILAVTFTNKAAREMQTRLAAMVPVNIRGMWIGTFHGLCNRLLRAHHREAGLPAQFQILDVGDQLSAIKRLAKKLAFDDEKFPPQQLLHFINANKERGRRAAQTEAYDPPTRRRVEFYAEYESQCQREGVVDFAELLLRCFELLQRNQPLREHYQDRFRHILVDEFQDTNRLQYEWLKLLAGHGPTRRESAACLFAVGDDDQSIYAFRGAEVGNMSDLQREFAIDEVIRLEQNYRSQGNILEAANALIRQNQQRLGKNLWTADGAGEPIRVFEGFSDLDEARFIVEEMSELIGDGLSPTQIALLYRSNAQSRVLEHELARVGLPYRIYGGLRFYDRQEIKHALAYLRLLANPDDDTAFVRVVNFPARGIGARSIEVLQEAAQRLNASLYNAAASLTGKPGAALARFVRLIETLRAESEHLPLPEIVDHVIEGSGLREHYLAEKDGADRLANLDELVNAATVFVSEDEPFADAAALRTEAGPLAAFLAHASLESGERQAGEGQDAVQLMTVHAAKGLEFDVVFISGLEQGLFPHENAASERNGLEEERRLMYVAITRARRRLYLSHAQSRMLHGLTRYGLRSSFLDELPPGLLRRLNAVASPSTIFGRSAPLATPASPRSDSGQTTAGQTVGQTVAEGLHVGQRVRHLRFGDGVIVASEGNGHESRVLVNFDRPVGEKWLLLEYARLSPL